MNLENFFSSLEAKSLRFSLSQVFLKNTKKQTNQKASKQINKQKKPSPSSKPLIY